METIRMTLVLMDSRPFFLEGLRCLRLKKSRLLYNCCLLSLGTCDPVPSEPSTLPYGVVVIKGILVPFRSYEDLWKNIIIQVQHAIIYEFRLGVED